VDCGGGGGAPDMRCSRAVDLSMHGPCRHHRRHHTCNYCGTSLIHLGATEIRCAYPIDDFFSGRQPEGLRAICLTNSQTQRCQSSPFNGPRRATTTTLLPIFGRISGTRYRRHASNTTSAGARHRWGRYLRPTTCMSAATDTALGGCPLDVV